MCCLKQLLQENLYMLFKRKGVTLYTTFCNTLPLSHLSLIDQKRSFCRLNHYSNNSVFEHRHYYLSRNRFVALASKQSTIVNLTKSVFLRTCEIRTCIVYRSKLRNGVRSLSNEKTLKYLQRARLTGFQLERFDLYFFIFQSTYKLTGSIKNITQNCN